MKSMSKKFIRGIIFILLISSFISIVFNSTFMEKYYLYQKKNQILEISHVLENSIEKSSSLDDDIKSFEDKYKVVVAKSYAFPTKYNDSINNEIQNSFKDKGLGFQKFWFWEEDQKRVLEGENMIRLYKQDNLSYSILVRYLKIDSVIYAVAMIVPNILDAFRILNRFLIIVNFITIIISCIFIIIFVRKITRPLSEFKVFARNMQNNKFNKLNIKTNDELESVADSLNTMGLKIMEYNKYLEEKNTQMECFLDDVAHELKTPISLIKLYSKGIKDEIDDGTFLDTIILENEKMSEMVEKLLYISKLENREYEKTTIDISKSLDSIIKKYLILSKDTGISLNIEIEKDIVLSVSEELIESIYSNLLSNAIKYSSGEKVWIELRKDDDYIKFMVSNETDLSEDKIEQIWTPYYVGEKSRNKSISGTGLGLSIVKKICKTQNYNCSCKINNKIITFEVLIPINI